MCVCVEGVSTALIDWGKLSSEGHKLSEEMDDRSHKGDTDMGFRIKRSLVGEPTVYIVGLT